MLYRLLIRTATWIAGAAFFVYCTWLIAAHSDGPTGIEIPDDVQRLYVSGLSCLGAVIGVAGIVEISLKRQQAAMVQHLANYRAGVRADLGTFLKDEITVFLTRSEAHGRARLVDELTETLGARVDAAVRAAASQAYRIGTNQGFARGAATVASVSRQDIPHVLGNNVLQLTPRDDKE